MHIFNPDYKPIEMENMGIFGGTYFRPIYSTITNKNYKNIQEKYGLKNSACSVYDKEKNFYKVKCGSSLETWEEKGWITKHDPYGWFQWYCEYHGGRRCDDDERQIARWKSMDRFKGTLKALILKNGKKFDDPTVSPKIRQVLLHWAIEFKEEDLN